MAITELIFCHCPLRRSILKGKRVPAVPVTALFIRALHAEETCVLIWSAENAAKRSHPK